MKLLTILAALTLLAHAETRTLRGWLSDEGCARGRVASGIFTGTNPECARQCVAKGAKTVLIDPDNKVMLYIENPEATRERVGDLVEITGKLDASAKVLYVDSVKLLEVGVASCARRKPAK